MTFREVEDRFKQKLDEFAKGGYRFNDQYTLYKQSQQEGFQGYLDGLSKGEKHGYIELPTGVGKTALFISLIKNYLDAANGEDNAPRVLIAVPTEKLAVQTAQAFAKFMPDIARTIEADGDKGQEIDWEKSDIGLQYGKMKHAGKKPKVLITTYQSLARDTANKTYPPEDFGLVVYDEGHVITSKAFGKAVDKFHDSIQLAVTATPEYTETKTVAARLPHRYFQLPLAEAINRGDLCNVRPAIIKTGYKIDEAMFQRFMEQQGNTPLNANQLQQLLNQEARNKAVVETYMRGADPDSGERYFGQNGMIFCTGIKHADAIATQFTKAMGRGEGAKLKSWLDRENVELIASVHGNAEGQWLKKGLLHDIPANSRKYEGNREWYSEQEIFDLHEKGKILLLASVAKLKAGYDSPRDSLLFDLADRFSKVDATQIDGRAFRLDPENPHKTATVFNLMDENTQELYAKFPKMIPIYAAEVIEGAEFRPPARRTSAQIRFREPPPGMDQSLQQAGFDVVTNIDAVRTISRDNQRTRNAAKILAPEKTSDWLNVGEMSKAVKTGYMRMLPLYKEAETAWQTAEKSGAKSFNAGNQSFATSDAGMFRSGSHTFFCFHNNMIPQLREAPEKAAEWLGATEMAKRIKKTPKIISPIYDKLEAAWQIAAEQNQTTFAANGITLPTDKAGIFKNGSRVLFCLHESAAEQLNPMPQKTAEWLSIIDMANQVNRGHSSVSPVYKSLKAAHEKAIERGEATFTAEGITLPVNRVGTFSSGTQTVFCIHKSAAPAFAPPPEKTDEWLGVVEMTERLNKSKKIVSPVYKALQPAWEEAKKSGAANFTAEGITLPTDKAGIFIAKAYPVFCLHEDAIALIPQFKTFQQKTEKWFNREEMARAIHTSPSVLAPLYHSLQIAQEAAEADGAKSFTAEGITLNMNQAGTFKNGARTVFCLHEDTADIIAGYKQKPKEAMRFADRVGGTKSIAPGSDHLKRTGKTLTKDEE